MTYSLKFFTFPNNLPLQDVESEIDSEEELRLTSTDDESEDDKRSRKRKKDKKDKKDKKEKKAKREKEDRKLRYLPEHLKFSFFHQLCLLSFSKIKQIINIQEHTSRSQGGQMYRFIFTKKLYGFLGFFAEIIFFFNFDSIKKLE